MSGKGTDSFDAEYSEEFLPFWRKELGLGDDAGVVIESAKDVRDILKHYYKWLLSRATQTEAPEHEYINMCNMRIPCGFTMIWGALIISKLILPVRWQTKRTLEVYAPCSLTPKTRW